MPGCRHFKDATCEACEPKQPATPVAVSNERGLAHVRNRMGVFSQFRTAMLDTLARYPVRARRLTDSQDQRFATREPSDPGVAVLDCWAYVLHSLTLYQEAYTNESFLRTATLRESLARIVALVGYSPERPRSATAYVAFQADNGVSTEVPAGFQIQSQPVGADPPAVFETAETGRVLAQRNHLKVLGRGLGTLTVRNRLVLAAKADGSAPVTVGQQIVVEAATAFLDSRVEAVDPDPLGWRVTWRGELPTAAAPQNIMIHPYNRRFRHFGHNAPPKTFSVSNGALREDETNYNSTLGILSLDAVYDNVQPSTVLVGTGATFALATVSAVDQAAATVGPMVGTCTRLTISGQTPTDVRTISVYELLGAFTGRREYDTGSLAGSSVLHLAGRLDFRPGELLILRAAGQPETAVLLTVQSSTQAIDTTQLTFTQPIGLNVGPAGVELFANVIRATHGETKAAKTLGNGNAALAWQSFELETKPITRLADPTSESGASDDCRSPWMAISGTRPLRSTASRRASGSSSFRPVRTARPSPCRGW